MCQTRRIDISTYEFGLKINSWAIVHTPFSRTSRSYGRSQPLAIFGQALTIVWSGFLAGAIYRRGYFKPTVHRVGMLYLPIPKELRTPARDCPARCYAGIDRPHNSQLQRSCSAPYDSTSLAGSPSNSISEVSFWGPRIATRVD
jgi:hypothetical protein